MGFNITLLACALADKDRLLDAAGFVETEKPDRWNETQQSYAILHHHYLVWQNWRSEGNLDEERVLALSRAVPLLVCFVSEFSMWTMTAMMDGGHMIWSMSHTSEIAIDDLQMAGPVPMGWQAIVEDVRREAASHPLGNLPAPIEVDYMFDAPVLMFKRLTDFKYDETTDAGFRELAVRRESIGSP